MSFQENLFTLELKKQVHSYFSIPWYTITFPSSNNMKTWINHIRTKWLYIDDKKPLFYLHLYRPELEPRKIKTPMINDNRETKNSTETKYSTEPITYTDDIKFHVVHGQGNFQLRSKKCQCEIVKLVDGSTETNYSYKSSDYFLDPMIRYLSNHWWKKDVNMEGFIHCIPQTDTTLMIYSSGMVPAIYVTIFLDVFVNRIPDIFISDSSALTLQNKTLITTDPNLKHLMMVPWKDMKEYNYSQRREIILGQPLFNEDVVKWFKEDMINRIFLPQEINQLATCYCDCFNIHMSCTVDDNRICFNDWYFSVSPTFRKYCKEIPSNMGDISSSGAFEGGFCFPVWLTCACPSTQLYHKMILQSEKYNYNRDIRLDIRGTTHFSPRDSHPFWMFVNFYLLLKRFGLRKVVLNINHENFT